VLAELAGKAALGDGFATKARPKKYYTLRKESLERFTEDVEQVINFVVIEFQRVIFAENIWATVAVRDWCLLVVRPGSNSLSGLCFQLPVILAHQVAPSLGPGTLGDMHHVPHAPGVCAKQGSH
jgi:hypothetical protein